MSIIAAGTTTTTALSSTGNTDGTLQFQVNGTTPSVTLNTLGAVGVGSTPGYGTSGQVLTSAGSTAAPTWTSVTSSQWTTSGSNIYYSTGKVSIGGTTVTDGNLLNIQGSAAVDNIGLVLNKTNGTAQIFGLQVNNSTNSLVLFDYTASATRLTVTTAGVISDQNGNLRAIPQTGSAKTGSYTLATTDVGLFVQVGSGGSITIPDATFAAGDVVSIFNNTSGSITITCTITTAYKAGTDSDQSSVTLQTRGVATVLFISGTVCVISGNLA